MSEDNESEKQVPTTVIISPATRKYLDIYKAMRGFKSLGAVIDNIIADKKTTENLTEDIDALRHEIDKERADKFAESEVRVGKVTEEGND